MIAQDLAALCSAIAVAPGSLPAERVIDLSISSLGAAILGSEMDIPARLAEYVRSMRAAPEAGAIGFNFSTSSECAAMLNCVASHATEYEDVAWPEGQYTCCLIPAMFSLGSAIHASGQSVIDAIAAGFEAAARPIFELQGRPASRGFLGSPAFGTIGAAAGAARLLQLDEAGLCRAITLAASMSGGLIRQTGSAAHVLEAGFAARCGVTAAMLAASGLGGSPRVMDGRLGFFDAFLGSADLDIPSLAGALRIFSVGQKKYPCGYPLQRIIDAFMDAVVAEDLSSEDVEEVRVHVNGIFRELMKFDRPENGEEARLSLPHVLANVLHRRAVDFRAFTDAAVSEEATVRLRHKFIVVSHEDWGREMVGDRNVVEIKLICGRVIAVERRIAHGDAEDPLSREETVAKFFRLTDGVIAPAQQEHILASLDGLASLSDVAPLMRRLTDAKPLRQTL